jgi:hypothetical protein
LPSPRAPEAMVGHDAAKPERPVAGREPNSDV